jgi:hypothetical protein
MRYIFGPLIFLTLLVIAAIPTMGKILKPIDDWVFPNLADVGVKGPLLFYALILLYAVFLGFMAFLHLYGVKTNRAERLFRWIWPWPANAAGARRPSEIVLCALASYVLSIYSFALAYTYITSQAVTHHFVTNQHAANLLTFVYFSIITMATVGFGDITPATDLAKILVSIEVLVGVAYQVFFFSIVAGFIRGSQP